MYKLFILFVFIFLCGCSTFTYDEGRFEVIDGDVGLVSVSVGLSEVNPRYYKGWYGDCPGCDLDAIDFHNFFSSNGYTSTLMLDSACTWDGFRSTVLNNALGLKSGDLIVITMSGHGGRIKDDNGDEADGMDSTICFWDGEVRDDEILKMLRLFPDGVRVVMINDQCHSEGNYKTILRSVAMMVGLDSYGSRTAGVFSFRGLDLGIEFMQFAGCRSAYYSYGSVYGGTWSQSLLATIGLYPELSWWEWFNKAKEHMPRSQVPVYSEEGLITESFRNQKVIVN